MKVNELQGKNPSWGLTQLFNEAGKATTQDLKLSKVADDINKDKGTESKDTALPNRGAGGGKKGGNEGSKDSGLSQMQKEIGAMTKYAEATTRRTNKC